MSALDLRQYWFFSSEDSDFNNKCEEMCQFFKKRGYPDSAVTTG